MRNSELLADALNESIEAKQAFLEDAQSLNNFDQLMNQLILTYQQGGRLYIAGNGGSAADAQHLAAELVCRLKDDRHALPAHAMTVDTSTLTAIANDFGYEYIFSRQIEANMTNKDMFLAITTSGHSKNILKALKVCSQQGIKSIVFSAYEGGEAKHLADYCLLAKGEQTNTIQEMHIVFAHALCRGLELALCPELSLR